MSLTDEVKLVGDGVKARLWTRSHAVAAPNPMELTTNVVQIPQQLPLLLAGPVVRRVESSQAVFWLATSRELILKCTVTDTTNGSPLPPAYATTTKLGENLFINLAIVQGPIPAGHLMSYNFAVRLTGKNNDEMGFDGDVLLNPGEVALQGQKLPTFFRAEPDTPGMNVAHASCRKFHAPGSDATPRLQEHLDQTATDLERRPSALHLTGDQIYADDVDPAILEGLTQLGRTMLGFDEKVPPDGKRVVDYGPGQRSFVLDHGFTVDSSVAGSHLLGFGDFAAMYVLSWSPEIWTWNGLRTPPSFRSKAGLYASPATRKVLANVPCYMICDDHEVTDDWYLNPKWIRDTKNDPVARFVMANALGAYWAFQGIGNNPNGSDAAVQNAVEEYTKGRGASPGPFQSSMLITNWNFTAPTIQPTIFLDTRTRRSFAPEPSEPNPPGLHNPPPGLLNQSAFRDFAKALQSAGGNIADPILVVSPGPFLGYKQAEDGLKIVARIGDPIHSIIPLADPEAWAYNPAAFIQFLRTLAKSGRKRVVILSGDVHYSFTAFASCTVFDAGTPTTINVVQATCSAIHNQPTGIQKSALEKVPTDDNTYAMLGFHYQGEYELMTPSELRTSNYVRLPIQVDLHLRWKYHRMGGSESILKDNSMGLVHSDGVTVEHTVLNASGSSGMARVAWHDIDHLVHTPFSTDELLTL